MQFLKKKDEGLKRKLFLFGKEEKEEESGYRKSRYNNVIDCGQLREGRIESLGMGVFRGGSEGVYNAQRSWDDVVKRVDDEDEQQWWKLGCIRD